MSHSTILCNGFCLRAIGVVWFYIADGRWDWISTRPIYRTISYWNSSTFSSATKNSWIYLRELIAGNINFGLFIFFCHQCIYEWCLNLMAHNMHWWHCRYAGRADAGSGAYAGTHLVRTLSIVAPALRCQHDVVPATSAIFCLFVKDEVPLFWASISLSPSPQAKKTFHEL